jgi:hypothetical protein
MPSKPASSPEGLKFWNVDKMIKMADRFCQTTVQKKEECECFWHKRLEDELGKYLPEES